MHLFVECLVEAALNIVVTNAEKRTENKTCIARTFPLKVFYTDRMAVFHETTSKSEIKLNYLT